MTKLNARLNYRGKDRCQECKGAGDLGSDRNGVLVNCPRCKGSRKESCLGTGQASDMNLPNLRVPPITLSLKSVNIDGQIFGDQLIRLEVSGDKFELAKDLNKLARVIAATSDSEYDEGTASIFVLRRRKS